MNTEGMKLLGNYEIRGICKQIKIRVPWRRKQQVPQNR